MIFTWSLPIYRQPVWLETIINDVIHQTRADIDHFINSNQMLIRCMHYDVFCAFTVPIIISTIWILFSHFSAWNTTRTPSPQEPAQHPPNPKAHSSPPASLSAGKNTTPSPTTPIQQRRTSNSPSVNINHVPSSTGEATSTRTGRPSTPGYQTPFVQNPGPRNFSHLAQQAPISYATLRRDGVLDAQGTPTKKFSPVRGG